MSAADPECDAEKVYSFVRGYVSSAKMNFEGGHRTSVKTSTKASPGSISISLPTADLDLCKVADLMEALREQQTQLQVDNIGLSLSTMDEVFLKYVYFFSPKNINFATILKIFYFIFQGW